MSVKWSLLPVIFFFYYSPIYLPLQLNVQIHSIFPIPLHYVHTQLVNIHLFSRVTSRDHCGFSLTYSTFAFFICFPFLSSSSLVSRQYLLTKSDSSAYSATFVLKNKFSTFTHHSKSQWTTYIYLPIIIGSSNLFSRSRHSQTIRQPSSQRSRDRQSLSPNPHLLSHIIVDDPFGWDITHISLRIRALDTACPIYVQRWVVCVHRAPITYLSTVILE